MGTRRTEAFLRCTQRRLETSDHVLLMTVCHKWNDHQVRPLELSFNELLGYMPYRHKRYPHRMLLRSLRRVVRLGVIRVEDNGRRYLADRWLRIEIVCPEFCANFALQTRKGRQGRAQAQAQTHNQTQNQAQNRPESLESRALSARRQPARVERAGPGFERAPVDPARAERATRETERASHSGTKDRKDPTTDQDRGKAAQLRGDGGRQMAFFGDGAMDGAETGAAAGLTGAPAGPGYAAWQSLLAELALTLPPTAYHTWVHDQTRYLADEDGEFLVEVANAYVRDWLHSRLRGRMTRILSRIAGRTVALRFVTAGVSTQWPVVSETAVGGESDADRASEAAELQFLAEAAASGPAGAVLRA